MGVARSFNGDAAMGDCRLGGGVNGFMRDGGAAILVDTLGRRESGTTEAVERPP